MGNGKDIDFNLKSVKNEILAANDSPQQQNVYSRKRKPYTVLEQNGKDFKVKGNKNISIKKSKTKSGNISKSTTVIDDKKYTIIEKTSCGGCQLQSKILGKEYYAYQVVPLGFLQRLRKKQKFEIKKSWASAVTSVQQNLDALKTLNTLYDSDKMEENEYKRLKKNILDSIVTAEEMNSKQFEETRNKFNVIYIDKNDDSTITDKAKELFNMYGGEAYPMFVHPKCRAKKTKDGLKDRSHCKEDGMKGVRGLLYYDKVQDGKSNLEIISDIELMLKEISGKYSEDDILSKEVRDEIEMNIKQLQDKRTQMMTTKPQPRATKKSKKTK